MNGPIEEMELPLTDTEPVIVDEVALGQLEQDFADVDQALSALDDIRRRAGSADGADAARAILDGRFEIGRSDLVGDGDVDAVQQIELPAELPGPADRAFDPAGTEVCDASPVTTEMIAERHDDSAVGDRDDVSIGSDD